MTDKQTIDDLNIFGKSGGNSIYHIFNKTFTRGGALLLEDMFRHPLSADTAINNRIAIIRYFQVGDISFPLQGNRFEEAERYLANTDPRSRLSGQGFTMSDFKTIQQSVLALIEILQDVYTFLIRIRKEVAGNPYAQEAEAMIALLESRELALVFNDKGNKKPSSGKIVECDSIFRFLHRGLLEKILRHIYNLDVYVSVARVAKERSLVFPKALSADNNRLQVQGVYHPLLQKAVPNSLLMTPDSNIVFLTGANMAGKSTFMKSLGIAIYLAHLGFPVAAASMEFTVCDGIYTTINLPDNLQMGASHFYAEVLRVKKIAEQLSQGKKLFVIFDELFRGTNVKDAYEATIAIMESFARKRDSLFVISTHIMEAGEVLRSKSPNMIFRYLPTRMRNTVPEYTYTLEEGITDDRHGMVIINNEGIVEQIKGKKQPKRNNPEFTADKQTVDDLNMLGKFTQQSVYNIFNKLQTRGGEKILEELFKHPLKDPAEINRRSELLSFFQQQQFVFPATRSQVESVEEYLSGGAGVSRFKVGISIIGKKIRQTIFHNPGLLQLQAGLSVTLEVLQSFNAFFKQLAEADKHQVFKKQTDAMQKIMQAPALQSLLKTSGMQLSLLQLIQYDYLLRHSFIKEMEQWLRIVYQLDMYIGVARVAHQHGFKYAEALPNDQMVIDLEGFHHPGITNAVTNDLHLSKDKNVLFLTGANMAGKSTFMKSFGIAIYLAHMGFPVAARRMRFSVKDGLFSSINVSDNLDMGYSHFYAEVLRTKTVATAVNEAQDLFVVFDELFKGTNVKDAYDATLAVTKAFSENRNCFFIVSTHIIEVGEALRKECNNLQFSYLPTVMEGTYPRYTYNLQEGITSDRQGMIIIENERILQMLQ